MVAPSYTTDLVDITTAESITSWTALGGGASGLSAETDFFVQGTACVSKAGWSAATRGMIFGAAAPVLIASPRVCLVWLNFWGPGALASKAAGGLQVIVGSSAAAYKHWYVDGSDSILPTTAWRCVPIDPNIGQDAVTGAPTSALQFFGGLANIAGAITKGAPFGVDVIRYGRGILQCSGGDAVNGYATFSGSAATSHSTLNRWGLAQPIAGGYLVQGLFLLGSGTTSVNFRDENVNVFIQTVDKVSASFNRFEVQGVNSTVNWTTVNVVALGTASRGDFFVKDGAAKVEITGSTFTDMGRFDFQSGSTAYNSTFRRCQLIVQSGSIIDTCVIANTVSPVKALLCNDPSKITNCIFSSGSLVHGIEISVTGTYTFAGNEFFGYGTSNSMNAAVFNNSGGSLTLNITNGGSTPTVRNGINASTTINSNVSVTLTNLKNPSEVRVFNAGTQTEIAGQENITNGTFVFSAGSGVSVDIAILSLGYQNQRLLTYNTTTDATLPISQQLDRQYSNT